MTSLTRKLRDLPGEARYWLGMLNRGVMYVVPWVLFIFVLASVAADDYVQATFHLVFLVIVVGGRWLARIEKKVDKTADTQAALERVIDRMSRM